jgi:hypothetical protein
MTTRVRLTFEARKRFPDIGTRHGNTTGSATELGQWHSVKWDGSPDTTWMRAEDLELVRDDTPSSRSLQSRIVEHAVEHPIP